MINSLPKRIIVAPDSFKGSLTATEVADIIVSRLNNTLPQSCEVIALPLADGGEGSLDVFHRIFGGDIHLRTVTSPDGKPLKARFLLYDDCCVVEAAETCGLTKQSQLNPLTATSYGLGQMISYALNEPMRKLFICIGGSACTDGGCGMASALGVKFFDAGNVAFIPTGGTLNLIDRIDVLGRDPRPPGVQIVALCDVTNVLYGSNGAAYVYAPQKGANDRQVKLLDDGLRHYCAKLRQTLGEDYSQLTHGGAGGGLGVGSVALLGAVAQSGINTLLNLSDFSAYCKSADLIITGEGRLDAQSFSGKVLCGVLENRANAAVAVVCGDNCCDFDTLRSRNIHVYSASEGVGAATSMAQPKRYLIAAIDRLAADIMALKLN